MSINRSPFFQSFTPFLPFLVNTNKNFEEKLKYSIKNVEKTFIVFAL